MVEATKSQGKLPFRIKLAYGVGAVGELVFLGMFNTFIGIYYNQAIGLSNALIGTAIMLALLGDAISDPAVGMISDRWKSRLGRRHPFLFAAPIPVAISLYMIFSPPDFLTQAVGGDGPDQMPLFLWLCFWTIVSRLFLTLYVIPHFALGGELTKEAHDRSRLFSINALFGYLTGAIFAFTAWGFFLGGETLLPDGTAIPRHLDRDAYGPLVFWTSGIVLFAIYLSAWGTKSQIPYLSTPPLNQQKLSLKVYYQDLMNALHNRNYRFLMFGFFFFMIAVGLNETLGVFINTYFWELETQQMRWFGLAAAPAILIGALLAPNLMRRFDRRPVLLGAIISVTILAQISIDLRLLGLFPANDSPFLLPILLACLAGVAASIAVAAVAVLSMLGDVADQNELAAGLRQEGLIYSARTFFAKASNSAGHFVAGILLDLFIRIPFNAVPGQVDSDIIFRLGLVGGPIMGLGALIAIPFYARYHLTGSEHRKILDELESKKAGHVPKVAQA